MKQVKTKILGGGAYAQTIPSAEGIHAVIDDWIVQDNIYIIGAEVGIEFDVQDEQFATATQFKGIVELTRAGQIERDGAIAFVELQGEWASTAVDCTMDCRKQIVAMLPAEHAIKIDSGEVINLCSYLYHEGYATGVFFGKALIYYVER